MYYISLLLSITDFTHQINTNFSFLIIKYNSYTAAARNAISNCSFKLNK